MKCFQYRTFLLFLRGGESVLWLHYLMLSSCHLLCPQIINDGRITHKHIRDENDLKPLYLFRSLKNAAKKTLLFMIIHDSGTNYKANWSYMTDQFIFWTKDFSMLTGCWRMTSLNLHGIFCIKAQQKVNYLRAVAYGRVDDTEINSFNCIHFVGICVLRWKSI